MIGLPPLEGPKFHVKLIVFTDVPAWFVVSLTGALGTTTTIAPFPSLETIDSPYELIATTLAYT